MREPVLRCKKCKRRFAAAPYADGPGRPEYCPTCTVQIRHEHEEQITCARCHKTFTAVRRDLRVGMPTYCGPCSRIVQREVVRERSPQRSALTEGQVRHWHSATAKQPTKRRFGPAARRRCQVGWDRVTHTFRGVILELTGAEEEITRWYADWGRATVVFEVEAPSIAALTDDLRRYADIGPNVRRDLLEDVPPHLRDQVNPASANERSV